MRYIVLFQDNPAADPGIRARIMPDHLSFLEDNFVVAAGPLRSPSGEAAGGLWIVEAETATEVDRLIREDPFWPTGLRKSWRILEWTRVFADGKRMIATE